MRLITGDETGLIKTTALEAQRIVVAGSQSRSRAIRALCWARGHAAYAAARQDGVVTVWEDGEKVPRLLREMKGAVGPDVVGMAALASGSAEERLVVAHGSGQVKVLAPFGDDSNAPSEAEAEATQGWEVTGPLSCMALAGSTVAAGGKERELGLWDAATGQAVWEARNVAHDSLDLRQPVWVTAASFLDEGARTVAVGTAYKQVRVYDARAQRRPVREAVALGDGGYRVTALCPGREPGAHLVTGDAGGTVVHLDVGTLRVLGRMEGPAGSVRGLARHPDGSGGHSFVAVAGLDRVARVYDLRRPRKEAHRFYLKQRLTAVLFAPEGRRGSKGKADAEAERRARVRAGGVDEEEVEGMEDDVGSFDGGEGSSDDEEGGFGEEEEEEESEGRSGGGGGKRKKAGAGMSYQRVYDDDESEGEDGGALEGEESEDQEEEEEEAHVPFGRRGDAGANNIELNIAGLDEEEEESSDEGEDEDEEADEESSEEDEELEPAPAPAVATKRARRR